jgi:hypothetical protein
MDPQDVVLGKNCDNTLRQQSVSRSPTLVTGTVVMPQEAREVKPAWLIPYTSRRAWLVYQKTFALSVVESPAVLICGKAESPWVSAGDDRGEVRVKHSRSYLPCLLAGFEHGAL